MSSIDGGITLKQWHEIEQIPGVHAAAPVAVVGYDYLQFDVAVQVPSPAPGQSQVADRPRQRPRRYRLDQPVMSTTASACRQMFLQGSTTVAGGATQGRQRQPLNLSQPGGKFGDRLRCRRRFS
jgi:hypothetical protein